MHLPMKIRHSHSSEMLLSVGVGESYFKQHSCSKHRENTLRKQCSLSQWFAEYNIGRKSPLMVQIPIKTEEVALS